MRKTDVIKFVELEKKLAIADLEKEIEENMELKKEELYKEIGLDELCKKIQPLLNEAYKEYKDFKKQKLVEEITYYTDKVEYVLEKSVSKENIKEYILDQHSIRQNSSIYKLEESKYNTAKKISKEYENIITNIKYVCKNGKEAEEYVKNLGFD